MYTSVHTARHKKQTERISWAIAIFVFSVEWDSLPPYPFATFLVSNSFWFVAAFLQLNLFVNFLIFLSRMEMFSWCLIEVQVIYMKISSLTSCSVHSSWMKRIESIILCEVTGYDSAWCLDTSEGGKAFFFCISHWDRYFNFFLSLLIHSVIWFKKHI